MSIRTVRLDDEAERALAEIREAGDMTISEALKRGLLVLARDLRSEKTLRAWSVYESINLGEGGYAAAPARQAKENLRKKRRR